MAAARGAAGVQHTGARFVGPGGVNGMTQCRVMHDVDLLQFQPRNRWIRIRRARPNRSQYRDRDRDRDIDIETYA
jgi:hypothetical protein